MSFPRLQSFNKKWLSLISLILLLVGLTIAAFLVEKPQLYEKKAVGENSSLTLPSNLNVYLGQDLTVPVMVNTAGADIGGIDISLVFPNDKLNLLEIKPEAQTTTVFKTFLPVDSNGSFNKEAVINVANANGRIDFGAVTFDWAIEKITSPFNGSLDTSSPLANLVFRANSQGIAVISLVHTKGLTNDSNLVDFNSTEDLLGSVNNLTVQIDNLPSPVPTATATIPQETPTPTAVPTLTPTPLSTPTPEPPSPTPTLIPTPTHAPQTGDLSFQLTLEGVVNPPQILETSLIISKDGQQETQTAQLQSLGGVSYQGQVFNLEPGSYDLTVKPTGYLSIKLSGVNVSEGETQAYEGSKTLLTGDISGPEGIPNNLIDIFDIALVVEEFDQTNSSADIDHDGKVTIFDITYIVANFDQRGEE